MTKKDKEIINAILLYIVENDIETKVGRFVEDRIPLHECEFGDWLAEFDVND